MALQTDQTHWPPRSVLDLVPAEDDRNQVEVLLSGKLRRMYAVSTIRSRFEQASYSLIDSVLDAHERSGCDRDSLKELINHLSDATIADPK